MATSSEAQKRTRRDIHSPLQMESVSLSPSSTSHRQTTQATLGHISRRAQTANEKFHAQDLRSQTSEACTKTLRLTENKRRYRARRKEYLSDLESRLSEAREQGVQASKEVQLAARQVALRNARLRDLLLLAGFSATDIDDWEGVGCAGDEGDANASSCDRRLQTERKARQCAAALASGQGDEAADRARVTPSGESASGWGPRETVDPEVSELAGVLHSFASDLRASDGRKSNFFGPSLADSGTARDQLPVGSFAATTSASAESPLSEAEKSSLTCHTVKHILPPCKLLTRLAENPAADITQVPIVTPLGSDEEAHQDAGSSQRGENIECRRAYDMLIQYATTEEKTDTIARALESGCTKSGQGGCGVRSEVLFQVLDHMCG